MASKIIVVLGSGGGEVIRGYVTIAAQRSGMVGWGDIVSAPSGRGFLGLVGGEDVLNVGTGGD